MLPSQLDRLVEDLATIGHEALSVQRVRAEFLRRLVNRGANYLERMITITVGQ